MKNKEAFVIVKEKSRSDNYDYSRRNGTEFTLEGSNGEEVRLADFRGKNVVLYFYPKDMTPGCTTEACDFRDAYGVFQEKDTVILGVSPDSANRHLKFIEKHELPFTLLVDEDHKVAELYDVWKLKRTLGKSIWESSVLHSLLIKTVNL